MRVLIASGKGGAGKTTVTASLARVWKRALILADADAEAPNLALYVPSETVQCMDVTMKVPGAVDAERCSDCDKCLDVCQFKAIVRLGERLVTFPNMCHGCGACFALCEDKAIQAQRRVLGQISLKQGEDTPFVLEARSKIGEAMTPPLLRELNRVVEQSAQESQADVLMDAPPGVSCPVMTAARACQAVVLVAEPTPFGYYDLSLAVQAFKATGKPLALIINRAGMPQAKAVEQKIFELSQSQALPILGVIPFDRAAAEQYSQAKVLADINPTWRERFETIAENLTDWVNAEIEHA